MSAFLDGVVAEHAQDYHFILDGNPAGSASPSSYCPAPTICGYTGFFREPCTLGLLDRIAGLTQKRPLEVLSLPCSTGEEVWSLRLLCNSRGLQGINLYGADVDPGALSIAQQACYPLEHITNPRLEGYLSGMMVQGQGNPAASLTISESCRQDVKFFAHDILSGPVDRKFDVVFCLNFLPHLSLEGARKALRHIAGSIHAGGFLVCEQKQDYFTPAAEEPFLRWLDHYNEYLAMMDDACGSGFARVRLEGRIPDSRMQLYQRQ